MNGRNSTNVKVIDIVTGPGYRLNSDRPTHVCYRLPMLWLRFSILLSLTSTLVATVPAQEPSPEEPKRISISTQATTILRHRPGSWSVVGVRARNPTDDAGEAMVSAYFAPEVGRQIARRMWVPAHAERSGWLPLEVPANVPPGAVSLSLTTLAIDVSAGPEVLQRRSGDLLTSEMALAIDREAGKTGLYLHKPLPDERFLGERDEDAYEMVMSARVSAGLPHSGSSLSGDFLPPWGDALQSFDQILLASDRITRDAAGLASLRAWVRDGGRLWILLDRVDLATVFAIMGHATNIEIVDRMELDRYELETTAAWDRKPSGDLCEHETPVEFVRVLTSAGDVSCWVNGWPAAIWLPCGDGEILLTALAPRGWRTEGAKIPTPALRNRAERFFAGRGKRLEVEAFEPALQEQIGYRIPRRSLPAVVLGGYCAGLLGTGLVLTKLGRLDWLSGVVPLMTVVASGALLAIGVWNTTGVRPTVASAQLLRFAPHTNEVRVEGLAAIYDQQSREISLRGEQRGWFISRSQSNAGEVRRHVWVQNDAMHTQNVTTFAGSVGLASFANTRGLSQAVGARAQFGPEGLEGKLAAGELQGVSDFVIVSPPAPALALSVRSEGSFAAGASQVLPAAQFTADALISDEQRRRQDVCRRLFDPTDAVHLPRQPTLLFWCRAVDAGISFPVGFEVVESALATLPLDLEPTPPQSPFQVPATFLRTDVAPGKQGVSGVYNPRTGQWMKKLSNPTETVLRFQLPRQVLPCRLSRGVFTVRVNAPSRELSIWAYSGGEAARVGGAANPNGVLRFELGPEQLLLDEQGGVRLGLTVGESQAAPTSTFDSSTWQIDYVRLTVDGQTL